MEPDERAVLEDLARGVWDLVTAAQSQQEALEKIVRLLALRFDINPGEYE